MSGKLQVIVGGQAGSEGKGAIAAHLAHTDALEGTPHAAVRVAGPNAGHTVWGPCLDGDSFRYGEPVEFKLRQIPVAAVANLYSNLYLAAGSEVDLDVLADEIDFLRVNGYDVTDRLKIDRSATILHPSYISAEASSDLTARLGSTSKGIGAARSARIWRKANTYGGAEEVAGSLYTMLERGGVVQIEGTQGYELGLHTDNYPFTTSSDCRAIDFLAMAGISPWDDAVGTLEVWIVFRTRPIRVAGNSGPLKGETSWDALGLPEEHTTVTGKVRRVGAWDPFSAHKAVVANGGYSMFGGSKVVKGALTMLDQQFPEVEGWTIDDWMKAGPDHPASYFVSDREEECGVTFELIGTSPTTVIDRRGVKYDV